MAKKEIKTRPDLDDEHYLAWLSLQKENAGIDVFGLYRAMLDWCGRKRITPTRLRLLNWLARDREAVPMTALPTDALLQKPARSKGVEDPEPACKTCNDTREITQKPKNAKYDWQVEFIPCPDCKKEKQPNG